MKILLDTHTFLWFVKGGSNLSASARALSEDVADEKFLGVASLWEIASGIDDEESREREERIMRLRAETHVLMEQIRKELHVEETV